MQLNKMTLYKHGTAKARHTSTLTMIKMTAISQQCNSLTLQQCNTVQMNEMTLYKRHCYTMTLQLDDSETSWHCKPVKGKITLPTQELHNTTTVQHNAAENNDTVQTWHYQSKTHQYNDKEHYDSIITTVQLCNTSTVQHHATEIDDTATTFTWIQWHCRRGTATVQHQPSRWS
jgi:hypothetical protein